MEIGRQSRIVFNALLKKRWAARVLRRSDSMKSISRPVLSIALRFKDEAGSPRLTLGVEDESSLLVLSDKTGRPRVGFVTLAHGAPGVSVYDATGRARVELGLVRDGTPRMALLDARGGTAWKAP